MPLQPVVTIYNETAFTMILKAIKLMPGQGVGLPEFELADIDDRPGPVSLAALIDSGSIRITVDGVTVTAEQMRGLSGISDIRGLAPAVPAHSNATRPAPGAVALGRTIFNSDDGTLNVSDGTNWIDITTGLPT